MDDLGIMLDAAWEARTKWYNLGVVLGTPTSTLDAIKVTHMNNTDNCITATMTQWLNGDPRPTWAKLQHALAPPVVRYHVDIGNFQNRLMDCSYR